MRTSISRNINISFSINQNQPLPSISKVSRRALVISCGILPVLSSPQGSFAGILGENSRRELALCLVSLLRLKYWVETLSQEFILYQDDEIHLKDLYLEARLGAKAAVTGKTGGGSNYHVYTISSLKVRETLDDIAWYAKRDKNQRAVQLKEDLVESLASIVEFDGLESTQDPSPRSSLTLSMYDGKKLNFVTRMLQERILPTADALFNEFDSDTRQICLDYAKSNYPDELPKITKVEEFPTQ
eukprot:CAMPEP_0178908820 /NCGR_PEP_ID=MMETSP0786-20121207/8135_1 /TAXON_ID=186022 /ORGANISM="Thalassionema frauenfeldii, Strain CCMP 1798" /LENGTH=242 /DNA_ID=CAMNT_0020580765 /DNA_START=59 /DNA_END=787 /DNA_ORIENTATION=-